MYVPLRERNKQRILFEKLTRYVTILYVSLVSELLEKNASSEYLLEQEASALAVPSTDFKLVWGG